MTPKEFNDILDTKLAPIIKIVEDHENILRGQSRRGGIIGDVNKFKWLSFSGLTALFWKIYDWAVKNG